MRLISVNVGSKQQQTKGQELETTGIYKVPAAGAVAIRDLGLDGDFICDQKNHGGRDQAVYIYSSTDYDWWSAELDRELAPGTFGENLTISDLESALVGIGDRLQIGPVVLEVTAPRIPCSTLAARMRDPEFVKTFRRSERPGFYCRVIEAGAVEAGNEIVLRPRAGERVSILEMFRNHYARSKDEATLRRFLKSPISERARASLQGDLAKLANRASKSAEHGLTAANGATPADATAKT